MYGARCSYCSVRWQSLQLRAMKKAKTITDPAVEQLARRVARLQQQLGQAQQRVTGSATRLYIYQVFTRCPSLTYRQNPVIPWRQEGIATCDKNKNMHTKWCPLWCREFRKGCRYRCPQICRSYVRSSAICHENGSSIGFPSESRSSQGFDVSRVARRKRNR